jgi:FKBP-type peptidyl-prolyl cis-trans isomerase FklB
MTCDIFRAMKKLDGWRLAACSLVTLMPAVPMARAETPPPTPAAADDALYTMGLNVGQQLRDNGVANAPLNRIDQGIKDGLAGKKPVGADEMRMQGFLRASSAAATQRNAAAAHEFLARNAKAPGVKTTASGLQYKIIEAGDANAASPQATDQVTVNFRGTFLDGSEFDSSSKPGTASTLQVNGLMKGWTEALSMMKPGAHWQLFVPPELGFGPVTRLGVPGGSLLIYDLQLLSVAPSPTRPPTAAQTP